MVVCPRCKTIRQFKSSVERDSKTRKRWLISSCAACNYHISIEEYSRSSFSGASGGRSGESGGKGNTARS